ncbi:small integral membrane protein [Desulfosporosinus acidiphilus SJ4]|uniref:Small integral membrane protein n=1 Tax=Desulfosporosinus acidiphilus (strain DSM 22704 / JCM 16185 / SJ4) TaxID=646529 RepID=I4D8W4_DESAJ|nr:DUF2273 domain-containing protein [Desulfosporosinus acidiphilus]AFM42238.1 small integral membrane protein [Desulfosporosinus acidiphilus SJ4]
MSDFWHNLGEKLTGFIVWALNNHPGKLIGTSIGFVTGLLAVTLGFWRTMVLTLFVLLGFIIGKRQDDHQDIMAWLKKTINK